MDSNQFCIMGDSGINTQDLAFIGLGTNLGNRKSMLVKAVEALQDDGFEVVFCSSVYETLPWGVLDQPNFLNMVVAGKWMGSPQDLLKLCLEIERSMGRVRTERYGPRTIDLDLLAFGDHQLDLPGLQLPHPRMHERAFVMVPMEEIAPEYVIPGLGCTVAFCLRSLPDADKIDVKRWVELDPN